MKNKTVQVTLLIISFFLAKPSAFCQDIGATFCWQYEEIYGGHRAYPHNKSIVTDNLPSSNTTYEWEGMTQWWENMAEEIDYSGIDYVALLSRGNGRSDLRDRGEGDPKYIEQLKDAMKQRGATFKLAIFDDCPNSWTGSLNWDLSNGNPNPQTWTKFDCANTNNYKYIWDQNLKVAIEAIGDPMSYKINGKLVIFFWSAKNVWMTNLDGNLSKILKYIRTKCKADLGLELYIIVDKSWLDNDTSIQKDDVDAVHDWFSAANQISNTLTTHNGVTTGVVCPGFVKLPVNNNFLDPKMGSPDDNGTRLRTGLENTVKFARTTLVEGFTDAAEGAALWRSNDKTYYNYPNQRLNILRRFTKDPYPDILKVEAEACDSYSDKTTKNTGGVFLKSGSLDVLKCAPGIPGWFVANTQAGEWMEWKLLPLLKNTKFSLRYKSSSASSIKFTVNGKDLQTITLPDTNNIWTTMDAGVYTNTTGDSLQDVRLTIVTGAPNINYFLRVNGPQTYQAEDAVLSAGAVVNTNEQGYVGSGYVNFTNATGDNIFWTVNMPIAGNYILNFRYSLISGSRPLQLKVNGVASILDFPVTGSWSTWMPLKITKYLNAGNNYIRLSTNGSNGGNIDQLNINSILSPNSARIAGNLKTLDVVQEVKSINIYPNPLKDGKLSLDLVGFETLNDVQVKVTNLLGKTIHQEQLTNKLHIDLNLSGKLNESVYFISVESGDTKLVKKLIVN